MRTRNTANQAFGEFLSAALLVASSALGPAAFSGPAAAADRPAEQHESDDRKGPGAHSEADEKEQRHEEGTVSLTKAELREFGIKVEPAGPGTIETYVALPGEVRPNADRLAHIVPRYSGIVTEVRANIGDMVRQGQVLAIIESDESLSPFELKTLIPGTVIGKHITLGEAVSRDFDTYVIADLSTVWVDLSIYQRDLTRVKVGQSVWISAGHGIPEIAGTISYTTPVVNEETRTATARVVLPNPRGVWRPGMFVTGRVVVGNAKVPVAVPRTALQTIDGETVVFVRTKDALRPRGVTIGRAGGAHVEILSGLAEGELYVSRGGFTLKAELSKSAFDEGHAH